MLNKIGIGDTPYGHVYYNDNGVQIDATREQLYNWANRLDNAWPCSNLAELISISATFDSNGLLELDHPGADDIPSNELNAWSSDILRDALPTEHPCWFVTVGQFDNGDEDY